MMELSAKLIEGEKKFKNKRGEHSSPLRIAAAGVQKREGVEPFPCTRRVLKC